MRCPATILFSLSHNGGTHSAPARPGSPTMRFLHMSRFPRHLLRLLIVLLALSALRLATVQPQSAVTSNHVVIISLDGFAGWALDDARLPVPALRQLAARGATAKVMRPVNPSVTWPNHTAMVTGVTPSKHGVLFNGLLVREPGVPPRIEPWRDKKELVRVQTLYDLAHGRGLTTAQVDWVAIQNAPTITWEFRERPDPNGEIARELVKEGILSAPDLETFPNQNILWRDHVWTMAAAHILRQHRPNLLLFHLLNLDSTQHRYGPRTPAAMTAMAHLDTQVATIVRTIEESGLAPRTTVFVVSDHGFKLVKRQIRPNAAFLKAGLLAAQGGTVSQTKAYAVPEGGSALVYVTAPDPAGEILGRVKQSLAGIEGIDKIVDPADYAAYGLPLPAENDQMGALFLTARDGYAFTAAVGDDVVVDAPAGSLGAHGYVGTEPDMRALFIASGRGITPGATAGVIDSIDVAPTAARLLGLDMPGVEGKILKEILAGGNQ
jgi:predicted AlkP superfamily pyrophosphatase or phosphodiesterase